MKKIFDFIKKYSKIIFILYLIVLFIVLIMKFPQMNMFFVGMQIKVLVGVTILLLTTRMLPNISSMIYTEIKTMIVTFVEAMM